MILVVGATGVLGGTIVHLLLSQGKTVRVLLRRNSPSIKLAKLGRATSAESLIDAGAQPVFGDLREPASLVSACQGVNVVITTATSVQRNDEDTVETVDRIGNRNLIDAARRAGVRKFIFISTYGATPDNLSPYMAAKAHSEEALKASGMDYTILAPTAFMEIWPAKVVGLPIKMGKPVTLVGNGRYRNSFISIQDVAAYAAAAVDHPAAKNQVLNIGGPEALSYLDVIEAFERAIGQPIPVEFIQPGEPAPYLPPGMQELLEATDFDIIVDSNDLARTFGIIPTTLEEVVHILLTRGFG